MKFIKLYLTILLIHLIFVFPAYALKIGIIHSDADTTAYNVMNTFISKGYFSLEELSMINIRYSTPTLNMLAQYDAVLVWTNYTPNNSTLFGNVLADYADMGGGVVLSVYAFDDTGWGVSGRIMTDGYSPFKPAKNYTYGGYYTLNTNASNMNHEVFNGVTGFTYYANFNSKLVNLNPSATLLGVNNKMQNLVAVNNWGNIYGINIYPGYSKNQTSAIYRLYANALILSANAIDNNPPVPEPATLSLLSIGIIGLAYRKIKNRRG